MGKKQSRSSLLKGIVAASLLFNHFGGYASIINASINNSLNQSLQSEVQENGLDSVLNNNQIVTIPNEESLTIEEGGNTLETNETQSEVELGNVQNNEEIINNSEKEESEQAHLEEQQESSSLETEEQVLEDSTILAQEYEEISTISESRSIGSGLVQLWQVVPGGQNKEGKTTSQIMSALQCRPNHNLYPLNGQSQHQTYVNSCYVDDALYIGEDSNYYYIYLSGYEGKVPKSETHTFSLDLNEDGKYVDYQIQTVAYYVPASNVVGISNDEVVHPDVTELNYYDQYLSKYSDTESRSIESYSTTTVQSPSYYANDNGTLVHYVTNNVKVANNYSKVIVGKAPNWMSTATKYYSYDGIYFYKNWKNVRVNGQGAVNQNNPFYNYYQYLPFRSKTNYSANTIDNYTNKNGGSGGKLVSTGKYFYAVQDKYGINGALQYAMGIHESGWGKSSLSINKNNLFGMNATDNNPYGNGTSFPTVEAGINYHADRYLSWGYTDPIDDYRYFGSHVGNKGSGMNVKYASDPFWGEKIAGWYYRFDNTNGMKDYDYYSIGIKQANTVIDVKYQATSGSKTLYQTKNKHSNLTFGNYPFLIIGEQSGYYKVKTDTPIINQKPVFSATYNWCNTYGYITKSVITVLNHQKYTDPLDYSKLIVGLTDLAIKDKKAIISGYMYLKGIDYSQSDEFDKSFILEDNKGNVVFSTPLTTIKREDISKHEGHGAGKINYDYSGYKGNIDLSKFKSIGTYYVKIHLKSNQNQFSEYITLKNDKLFPLKIVNSDYTYDFRREDNKLVIRVDKTVMDPVVGLTNLLKNNMEI